MRSRLAPRPTIPAEALSTPTSEPTRRGNALTATRSTSGASSQTTLCSARHSGYSRGARKDPRDAFEAGTTAARSLGPEVGHRLAPRSAASEPTRTRDHGASRPRRAPQRHATQLVADHAGLTATPTWRIATPHGDGRVTTRRGMRPTRRRAPRATPLPVRCRHPRRGRGDLEPSRSIADAGWLGPAG